MIVQTTTVNYSRCSFDFYQSILNTRCVECASPRLWASVADMVNKTDERFGCILHKLAVGKRCFGINNENSPSSGWFCSYDLEKAKFSKKFHQVNVKTSRNNVKLGCRKIWIFLQLSNKWKKTASIFREMICKLCLFHSVNGFVVFVLNFSFRWKRTQYCSKQLGSTDFF